MHGVPAVIDNSIKVYFTDKLFTSSWTTVMLFFVLMYFSVMLFFTALFVFDGDDSVTNAQDDAGYNRFERAFYLSVQTFTTIGYGYIAPKNTWSHVVVTFESFCSLWFQAVFGGAVFMKLIRPVEP